MVDYDATLHHIYQEFASFGATRGAAMPMMDGPKFAKFAKDSKLLDKANLTATDVDLIFAKAKSKTERRITYDQFFTAVTMLADKRYPDQTGEGAFEALMKKIITSQGPTASSATVADSSGIYGKLTDTNLYTGAHKERFNADGTGKGIEGRDKIVKGTGSNRGVAPVNLQFRTDEDPSPPVSDDEETNEALAEQVAQLGISKAKSASPVKPALSKSASSGKSPAKSPPGAKANSGSLSKSASKPAGASKPSIFDKLTDSSQYTGSHKNRFNSDGSGRGMAGRDSVRKGGVSGQDLSQMVRRS